MADERKIEPVLLNETGLEMLKNLKEIAKHLNTTEYNSLNGRPIVNGSILPGNVNTELQVPLHNEYGAANQNIKTIGKDRQHILGVGNIDLDKEDVGLSNVDNTSDADKPISAAQAAVNRTVSSTITAQSIEINSKQPMLSEEQTKVINSGVTKELVEKYNNYEKVIEKQNEKIIEIKTETVDIEPKIKEHIANIGEASVVSADNKAIASFSAGVHNGKMTININKEIDIPTNNNQLTNGKGYVTMPEVQPKIDAAVSEAVKGVFVNHTDNPNINYSGDTVVLKTTFTDIATKATDTKLEQIKLADTTNAGLMSPEDKKQLAENTTKIKSLSGQASRSLYVVNEDLKTIEGHENAFYINGKLYSLDTSEVPYKIIDYSTTPPSIAGVCDEHGNVNINGTDYNFYYDSTTGTYKGKRPETQKNIEQYAKDQGYVEPYTGVSIVIEGSTNVWRYYPNKEDGKVIGWKNDGADTVQQFTNTASGTIKGSTLDGKVFAEDSGVGSVNGWSDVKTRIADLEARPTNVMTFTYGSAVPTVGTIGEMFLNTSNGRIYFWNGAKFEAMNTYQ